MIIHNIYKMKDLILKEFKYSLANYRLLMCTLSFIILIPLNFYLSFKKIENDNMKIKMDEDNYEAQLFPSPMLSANGYRYFPVYSIFSHNMNFAIPSKVSISRDSIKLSTPRSNQSYYRSIMNGFDYGFVIVNILTIIVFVLAFDIVAGEKENGTLKLVFIHLSSRYIYLLSKMIYLMILISVSLLISFIAGLLLINILESSVLNSEVFLRCILIFFVTIVYFLVLCSFSLFVSIITNKAKNAVVLLFLIWCFYSLLIPKLSPMIASVIYPIETRNNIDNQINHLKLSYRSKLQGIEDAYTNKALQKNNIEPEELSHLLNNPIYSKSKEELDKSIAAAREKFTLIMDSEVSKIQSGYKRKKRHQDKIAINISRISPMSCFSMICCELSSTGFAEMEHFENATAGFKESVESNIFNNFNYERYHINGRTIKGISLKKNVNFNSLSVPRMYYVPVKLKQILKYVYVDFLILITYAVFFFSMSLFFFNMKDIKS